MRTSLCPVCDHVNASTATFCNACGAVLRVRAKAPARVPTPEEETIVPQLHLSDALWVDPPPVLPRHDQEALIPNEADGPGLWAVAPVPRRVPPQPVVIESIEREPPTFDVNTTKAARRAAVRRTRIARLQAESQFDVGALSAPPDVLVLDPSEATREPLCHMLESFGFQVHRAMSLAQAGVLLEERPYAAVFLDIVFDGSDQGVGLELCERVKHPIGMNGDTNGGMNGGASTALIVLSGRPRPVDRVRAALAGCERFIAKPAGRGDVVSALEASGVPLPDDQRRA